jgi:hypothetical protein
MVVEPKGTRYSIVDQADAIPAVRELVGETLAPNREAPAEHKVRFDSAVKHQILLTRSHPLVESLASHVLQSALDPKIADGGRKGPVASRCGLVQTAAVRERTTVLLLRNRYQIEAEGKGGSGGDPLLAEDAFALALEGDLSAPRQLPSDRAAQLINVTPSGNFDPERAQRLLASAVGALPSLAPMLASIAAERASELAVAHDATRSGRKRSRATAAIPTGSSDILGLFILMPADVGGRTS